MISFVAPSGTGKTTMVEQVIAELVRRGLRVAGVKHDAHRIELDTEGKDSWRIRKAGADTLLVGANQLAWMSDHRSAPSLDSLVELFFAESDVVIVEGYRSAGLPTVLVQRPEISDPTWHRPADDRIIATVHPSEVERAVEAVIDCAGLAPGAEALRSDDPVLEALVGVDHEIVACDPALADTEAFCRTYGYAPDDSANAILVVGKTEDRPLACCLVLATDRLDVNGVVRKRLGVRKASFADAEETVERSGGMEIGGVTPFGLPPDLPVWIDAAVMERDRIIVGGGSRDRKILCPPRSLLEIDGAAVVDGLAKVRPGD
jgi:molybdopterin-guanine dinucleotide biosynthesis protein MobB